MIRSYILTVRCSVFVTRPIPRASSRPSCHLATDGVVATSKCGFTWTIKGKSKWRFEYTPVEATHGACWIQQSVFCELCHLRRHAAGELYQGRSLELLQHVLATFADQRPVNVGGLPADEPRQQERAVARVVQPHIVLPETPEVRIGFQHLAKGDVYAQVVAQIHAVTLEI